MRRPMARLDLLPTLLLALAASTLARPARAQQAQDAKKTFTLVGRITAAGGDAPLEDAIVSLLDQDVHVFTDGKGLFALRGVHPGLTVVRVERIGYADFQQAVQLEEGSAMHIALKAQPIQLERLDVRVRQLDKRLADYPYPVLTFDREAMRSAPDLTAEEYLRTRAMILPTRCSFQLQMGGCIYYRGRSIEPSVYLDEAKLLGGLAALRTFHANEIARLEVFRHGTMIRAYTLRFMDQLAKGRESFGLAPLPHH